MEISIGKLCIFISGLKGLTISDSRSTATIFPWLLWLLLPWLLWPIIKLPPCRDLQGEIAEKLLPYFTPERHSFV